MPHFREKLAKDLLGSLLSSLDLGRWLLGVPWVLNSCQRKGEQARALLGCFPKGAPNLCRS